jgi:hypothetical protein
MKRTRILSLLGITALAAASGQASVTIGSTGIEVGGFVSQGWLYSANNNHPTANKGGTWDFREMALNASTTFGSHFRVGAQAFAQRLGKIGQDKVILDWAVADYNFRPEFGIRAGRVKFPRGLYGEALDLDLVRPFVFLPLSFYNPVLRDLSASFDGGMFYGSVSWGESIIDYRLFAGRMPAVTNKQGIAEFYNDGNFYANGVGEIKIGSVTGGQITWNPAVSGLKFVASYSRVRNLETRTPFPVPGFWFHDNFPNFDWRTLSVEYTRSNWVFAAEWQRAGGEFFLDPIGPFVPQRRAFYIWQGWYVAASRRINEHWEFGAYYSHNKNHRPYNPHAPSINYQKDLTFSVRYDITSQWLIKLELHRFDGTFQVFDTPRSPNPNKKNGDTLWAAKTTFSF